jgi:asparagine synthase (glutamine-hydrolysing)
MSAICGIIHLDQQPLQKERLDDQMTALAHYGPDGSGAWLAGGVGLGQQVMFYTPESQRETLPLQAGDLVIVADARLDNRPELCALLQVPHTERERIADSALILSAYRKWGQDCPAHLLGDFAFAIWDARQQSLFCARDPMGIRPFYYHLAPRLFVFASDVRGVIAHPAVPQDLDQHSLALHLMDISFVHKERTFFDAVKKLPPAHTLTVRSDGALFQRYWHPADCPPIRMKGLDAYAEALRELLQQAVACRLRTPYPVGAHLSGGLDSSTIAVLAARLLRDRGQALPTYNWIPAPAEGDDADSPEFAFSRLVCEQEGLKNHIVEITVGDVVSQLWQNICIYHALDLWYEPLVQRAAKADGIKILLSGWGGDELVTFNGSGYYTELFWKLKWFKLAQAIHWRGIHQTRKDPVSTIRRWLANLYYKVILPSLPDQLYALIDREWLAPKWVGCVTPEFKSYIDKNPLLPHNTERERIGLHANQVALLERGYLSQRIEAWANNGALEEITYAYPLLDQRIVAFSLGIPPELYVKDGYARYLLRYATDGILPVSVRWGSAKYEPQRVKQYLKLNLKASQAWLCQAENQNWLNQYHPYIDAQSLLSYARNAKNFDDENLITTLLRSIQALIACNKTE